MAPISLRAEHLSFSYGERVLLDDVTFHLSRGWTGIVGANGAGKSTLLRLITGDRRPTSGTIRVEPVGHATIALCSQEIDVLDEQVHAFGMADDGLARRLQGRLELDPSGLARWETLSCGERKRWQVGAALWCEPEVLLLDEPTNHLDAQASELLRASLMSHRGVGLLVSHDCALLDALTESTLRLDSGQVRLWPGGFSRAREAWVAEED